MSRIHLHLVRQEKQLLFYGAHKLPHTSRRQICPSHRRLKKSISTKQDILFWEIIATSTYGMTRRIDHTDLFPCGLKFLTIRHIPGV